MFSCFEHVVISRTSVYTRTWTKYVAYEKSSKYTNGKEINRIEVWVEDGVMYKYKGWFANSRLHRMSGPAALTLSTNGNVIGWFNHGVIRKLTTFGNNNFIEAISNELHDFF